MRREDEAEMERVGVEVKEAPVNTTIYTILNLLLSLVWSYYSIS